MRWTGSPTTERSSGISFEASPPAMTTVPQPSLYFPGSEASRGTVAMAFAQAVVTAEIRSETSGRGRWAGRAGSLFVQRRWIARMRRFLGAHLCAPRLKRNTSPRQPCSADLNELKREPLGSQQLFVLDRSITSVDLSQFVLAQQSD